MTHHILVAEDEADIRDLLQLALSSAGYTVESAGNGRLALERALAVPPRLLITDLRMPEMDGLELIGAVRADPRLSQIPVILFTAYALTDDRVDGARQLVGVEVVTKGQLAELRRAVDLAMIEGSDGQSVA